MMGNQQLQSMSEVTIIAMKIRRIVNSWKCISLFQHSKILILKRIHVQQNIISTPTAILVIRSLYQQAKYFVENYSFYYQYSSISASIATIICYNKLHSTYHIPFFFFLTSFSSILIILLLLSQQLLQFHHSACFSFLNNEKTNNNYTTNSPFNLPSI
ncbi:hypothetical protein BDC45DRAFT_506733 [Circinella umbellata]|nr:hypothetical protein BDC45DRAFT_506733 [Circinella umbellata]